MAERAPDAHDLPAGSPRVRITPVKVQLAVSIAAGVLAGVLVASYTPWELGPLVGWDTAAVVYLVWVWVSIWPHDAEQTATLAVYTDPTRTVADFVLLSAAVASLISVATVIARAAHTSGTEELLRVGLGVASVLLSWAVVHTVFTLRYAKLYYTGPDGGVDFNQDEPPDYGDFAYLAFTIGMTFQVSDTNLRTNDIRRTALRHGLLSYLLGTGVLATTINLVASISSK
ncbi:MAG TPA: DUF1345 domain-containing protein [Pseudonocardiaceae bacterium]|jgi:uncharacterized membrane protein|nr:DUF1345 domain-containing protein [Pseudonocardiaceae bacterium]